MTNKPMNKNMKEQDINDKVRAIIKEAQDFLRSGKDCEREDELEISSRLKNKNAKEG